MLIRFYIDRVQNMQSLVLSTQVRFAVISTKQSPCRVDICQCRYCQWQCDYFWQWCTFFPRKQQFFCTKQCTNLKCNIFDKYHICPHWRSQYQQSDGAVLVEQRLYKDLNHCSFWSVIGQRGVSLVGYMQIEKAIVTFFLFAACKNSDKSEIVLCVCISRFHLKLKLQ